MKAEPLWSDSDIAKRVHPIIGMSEEPGDHIDEMLHLIRQIRDEYEAERAAPQAGAAVPDDVREALAEYAHEAWSGWMKYLFEKGHIHDTGICVLPHWAVERWTRQMNTPYADLSEEEKKADREEADRMLATLQPRPAVMPMPSWVDAPMWAMWWCVGPDQRGFWFEKEPTVVFDYWLVENSRWDRCGFPVLPLGCDWRLTLQPRPAAAAQASTKCNAE